ncbi:MAG: right-handed parallel beta-helix repeat-containing protein [Cyclobacteriaceae bacterium]
MNRMLLAFSLMVCVIKLNAKDYYVSKDGADTNNGEESTPFLSISKAASLMVAGDRCIIKEGVYRETLSPAKSGSEGAPITFMAYEQDTVIVSATETINDWSQHNGNIYKATVDMPLGIERNMLYANSRSMDMARWPNNVDGNAFTIDAEPVDNGSGGHIERNGLPNHNWSGGYIWYLGAHSGASWTRKVTSSSSNRIDFEAVDVNKWPFNPHNPTVFRNGNRGRFYLFGKLEALDIEKEWYADLASKTLYFYAPGGVSPNTMQTEYTAREESIELNQDYIVIDGLHTFGGMVKVAGDHCQLKNCVIRYGLTGLDELDNTDAQMPIGSVTVEGSYNLIEHNLIEYGSGNGIAMLYAWKGSTNNTVHNNIIRYVNTIGIHSNGIRSSTPYSTITNNTIYGCGRDGIYLSGTNGLIAYNDVYDCMRINNDGGVFYTVGNANDKNTVIHHNWFHDSEGPDYADGRAAGIYLDNHSKGYLVHHNMVWNVTWTGIQINWDNWNIDIYNNSIYKVEGAMGRWENGYTIDDLVIANNYASEGEWIGTDIRSNIVNAESPFISYTEMNFVPKATSSLIDAGIEIEGITDGFKGQKPDVGAYESGGESWVAGADWQAAEAPVEEEEEPEEEEEVPVLGLDENDNSAITIAPNPIGNQIKVYLEPGLSGDFQFNLYSLDGRLLLSEQSKVAPGSQNLNLNASWLGKGMYVLKIDSQVTSTVVRRIVKN